LRLGGYGDLKRIGVQQTGLPVPDDIEYRIHICYFGMAIPLRMDYLIYFMRKALHQNQDSPNIFNLYKC
jgi:hypothetical protein